MARSLKILLFSISGILVCLFLVIVALLVIVDINTYKPRLQGAASEALGMDVMIGGELQVDLFSGMGFMVEDVQIRSQGREFISVGGAAFSIDPLALLDQEIRIDSVVLKNPRINIVRSVDGTFNFTDPDKTEGNLPTLSLSKISLSDGTFSYEDMLTGEKVEAFECSLDMDNLLLSGGKSSDFLKNLSLVAELSCGRIQRKNLTLSDLETSLKGENGIFTFNPIAMNIFGAEGKGRVRVDYSGRLPGFDLNYSLTQFHLEKLSESLSLEKVVEGKMDLSTTLSSRGKTWESIKRSLAGEFLIEGGSLLLKGIDLDEKIAEYESSQNFSLVDIGASLLVGPLALAVTKGYDFFTVLEKSEGKSEIHRFISDWKIEDGVAQAMDVAMATSENRIALDGKLDFVEKRFNNITLAVVDSGGCVVVQQEILGTFGDPVIEQPSILRSLSGPVLGLIEMGRDLLPGGKCEVFYSGAVQSPDSDTDNSSLIDSLFNLPFSSS